MRTTSSGMVHDQLALQAEHDHDGEQQGDQGDRADLGDEFLVIPLLALLPHQDQAGEEAGEEGDAQVNEDALGNLANGDIDDVALHAQPGGQDGDENIGIHAVEEAPGRCC